MNTTKTPFYVSALADDRIWIRSLDAALHQPDSSFGAFESWKEPGLWYVPLESKANLPILLTKLRDKGLAFLDEPKGWPPAAIFAKLMKERKIVGGYQVITFSGQGSYEIKDAK